MQHVEKSMRGKDGRWSFAAHNPKVGGSNPPPQRRGIRALVGRSVRRNRIQNTIKHEPSNFWYYNNGITIVCDSAQLIKVGGAAVMRVRNPQVINGQQTTRTLHLAADPNSSASVIVRAIEIPRDSEEDADRFDTLVSRIVAATNWQNSISASDLMANDRRQVELEREFRKFGYAYLRKRQHKSEARRFVGQQYTMIMKEEIAQAVAACELDPVEVRTQGKEGLFEEGFYSRVLPTSDPLFYLTRYRLMREVKYSSTGYPERAYAKWLVLHYMWSRLAPVVRSRTMAETFLQASEGNWYPLKPLFDANNAAFRAAPTFFRRKRGHGEKAIDASSFFKRKGLIPDFERYLQNGGRAFGRLIDKRWERFKGTLEEMCEGERKAELVATAAS